MMKSLKVRSACFIVILLLAFFLVRVPIGNACSAVAQCGGGQIAWCETFGYCEGGGYCRAMDCVGVECTCGQDQQMHSCTIPCEI